MLDESVVHILGGGIGGTVGAVVTCPLEVVKVRLQSSKGSQLYKNCIPYHGSANTSASGETLSVKSTAVAYSPSSTKLPDKKNVILTAHQRNPAATHRLLFPVTANPTYTSSHRNSLPSTATVSSICPSVSAHHDTNLVTTIAAAHNASTSTSADNRRGLRRLFLLRCISEIINTEGFRALFKGLLPTLVGVLPSRAIYFCSYHKGQVYFERHLTSGSSGVYLCAAGFGSVVASTLTNPIWFIKTRMQLDSRPGQLPISAGQVIRNTWTSEGVRGFYRGVSASYVGSLETAVNFVLYENIKAELLGWVQQRRRHRQERPNGQRPGHLKNNNNNNRRQSQHSGADLRGTRGGSKLNASSDMMLCMLASAFSKFVAITAAYPHEVVRTRLREVHTDYRGFFGTLLRVAREEGPAALYRGMGTHYIRQVPNSCLMIGTYEAVVFLLQSWGLTKMNT